MRDDIWLEVAPGTSVAVDRAEAMAMTERDLARLYRTTVYGVKRREAREWARRQVALREAAAA